MSLLETLVAAGLLATVLTGIVPLCTTAVVAASRVRSQVLAGHLASRRLAQLEALTHARTAGGLVLDLQTRLDGPDFALGGPGLAQGGAATLTTDTDRWCDVLDDRGTYLGTCDGSVAGARFGRRWGVTPTDVSGCLRVWVDVRGLTGVGPDVAAQAGALQCGWGAAAP